MPRTEDLDRAVFAIGFLAERGGVPLDDVDRALLRTEPSEYLGWNGGVQVTAEGSWKFVIRPFGTSLSSDQLDCVGRIGTAAFYGFWIAAADGVALTTADEVSEWYGTPINQAYAGADEQFLRFATTYWTTNTVWRSLHSTKHVATSILKKLSNYLGDIFFPADTTQVDPQRWAQDQHRLVSTFAPGIDADRFVKLNPLLIQARQQAGKKRGWFG